MWPVSLRLVTAVTCTSGCRRIEGAPVTIMVICQGWSWPTRGKVMCAMWVAAPIARPPMAKADADPTIDPVW